MHALAHGLGFPVAFANLSQPLSTSTTMNKPLSIQDVRDVSFKARAKTLAGQIVSIFSPARCHALKVNPTTSPQGVLDRFLMAYLKRQALLNGDPQFFERLHKEFWQGEGGEVFSSNCDHRFQDLFLGRQRADFLALQKHWEDSRLSQIVEFGCNSGLLLEYLTRNLDGVKQADGIEINQSQVDANRASEQFDARVHFHCAEGGQWLLENGKPKTLFVTNGGVLEYFCRERLDEMMQFISQELKPAMFFAVEPVAPDHDWSTTAESIPFGEELSFSHNYSDLFESNGFEIVHQRATDFESWRMMATVAMSR